MLLIGMLGIIRIEPWDISRSCPICPGDSRASSTNLPRAMLLLLVLLFVMFYFKDVGTLGICGFMMALAVNAFKEIRLVSVTVTVKMVTATDFANYIFCATLLM